MNKKSILLLTAYYPPSSLIGAQRPFKLSRCLVTRNWDVTVVTIKNKYIGPIDSSLEIPTGIDVIRTDGFFVRKLLRDLFWRLRGSAIFPNRALNNRTVSTDENDRGNHAIFRLGNKVLQNIEFPDEWIGWKSFAKKSIAGRHFDIVLATIPPFSVATVAREIAEQSEAKLVLDYRDPWSDLFTRRIWNCEANIIRKHIKEEQKCIEAADLITTVSPTISKWLKARADRKVIHVFPHGADLKKRNSQPLARPVRLVYAGSLAYGRSLDLLLQAISTLCTKIKPSELQLIYCGVHEDILARTLLHYEIKEYVHVLPLQQKAEVAALLKNSVGIVLISKGYEYAYPGKLFDLIELGCPILCIGPHSSESAQLVREFNLGWNIEQQDLKGAYTAIKRILKNDLPISKNLDRLDVNHLMSKYANALSKLLRDKE